VLADGQHVVDGRGRTADDACTDALGRASKKAGGNSVPDFGDDPNWVSS
jgi:hypothetical protein